MVQEQYYTLSTVTIVATMKDLPGVVSLHAQIVMQEAGNVLVEILVGGGSVRSCTVLLPSGQLLLSGQEVLSLLQQYGNLRWRVNALSEDDAPSQKGKVLRPPSVSDHEGLSALIPYKHVPRLPSRLERFLSHTARQVYGLVDGSRSSEQIALLLSKTVPDVQRVLLDLQEKQFIQFK